MLRSRRHITRTRPTKENQKKRLPSAAALQMADRYSDLVLEIHAAASDPAAWTSVVEKIRVALHARGAMLHTPQVSFLEGYWCFHSQFETSQIESYARDWMAHDAWAEGARQRGLYSPERIISVDDALIERRSFRKTAFFQEYLRPNDVDRMVTVNLHRSRNQHRVTHVQLSVFRGLNKERFSSEDVKPLEQLRPISSSRRATTARCARSSRSMQPPSMRSTAWLPRSSQSTETDDWFIRIGPATKC